MHYNINKQYKSDACLPSIFWACFLTALTSDENCNCFKVNKKTDHNQPGYIEQKLFWVKLGFLRNAFFTKLKLFENTTNNPKRRLTISAEIYFFTSILSSNFNNRVFSLPVLLYFTEMLNDGSTHFDIKIKYRKWLKFVFVRLQLAGVISEFF